MPRSAAPRHHRSLFLSDLHLGALGCRADLIRDFLEANSADTIYLVGDILDIWHPLTLTWGPAQDRIIALLRQRQAAVEHLDRYRMAGHDLRIHDPIPVSLEIDLLVCVDKDHFRSDVSRGLLDALSSRTRADGTRGLFHPDHFSFGQTVFLSPLYAAARTVAGVSSVQVTRFQRQGQADPKPLADGFMTLGRLEIARLDNDPNFPEHGVLRLELHGGK